MTFEFDSPWEGPPWLTVCHVRSQEYPCRDDPKFSSLGLCEERGSLHLPPVSTTRQSVPRPKPSLTKRICLYKVSYKVSQKERVLYGCIKGPLSDLSPEVEGGRSSPICSSKSYYVSRTKTNLKEMGR